MSRQTLTLFDPALMTPAVADAFRKLDPRVQWRNPVMFVVYVGSAFTTALAVAKPEGFTIAVALWLWFTVLFANFAEALAEGRSKAQAASLLRRNLAVYGLGGVIVPFIGIKAIDLVLAAAGLA